MDGAAAAGSRAKGLVVAVVSMSCQAVAPACLDGRRRGCGQSRCGGRREEGPGRGCSRRSARRGTSRGREEGRWKVKAKIHALGQELQRLAQGCDNGNQDVTLLEDVLERDGEEVGVGDNEWLFGELERGNAVESPTAAKRRNLKARLVVSDTGRPKEGVVRLMLMAL